MPTLESYNGYYLWKYVPSLPAAALFTALFAILTFLNLWKMVKARAWFCTPFVVGGVCTYCHNITLLSLVP